MTILDQFSISTFNLIVGPKIWSTPIGGLLLLSYSDLVVGVESTSGLTCSLMGLETRYGIASLNNQPFASAISNIFALHHRTV